jgi:hypothetical protein
MDGIGAVVNANAERVFHEPEVFIASPEEGLQIRRDLQCDLQCFQWPPMGCGVEVRESSEGLASGVKTQFNNGGILYGLKLLPFSKGRDFEGHGQRRRGTEPRLWAVGRSRGLEKATKFGIWGRD